LQVTKKKVRIGVYDNMARDWDFDAGRLPLDFANTAEWHASGQPHEMLQDYSDLVAWSEDARLLSKSEAAGLLSNAVQAPKEIAKALKKAVALRDVIYRIISTAAKREAIKKADLNKFNQALAEGLENTKIAATTNGFIWAWDKSDRAFDQMLWPILRETAELLTSQDIKRVGQCADDRGCGYLFYDTSRNHSRRWCSMDSCGNRAKARRHYQRKK
jgi:predicted RNA-binding Zn ribbon-like protein